jgi:Calcineurin-like phosphoesterase
MRSWRVLFVLALGGAALVLGCRHEERPSEPGPAARVERESAPAEPPDDSFRRPAAARMVAFGDVHGDVEASRAALRLAGAIDEHDAWIGKNLVVVQTGDQLDRGDTEPEILDLFERLRGEAKRAGGAFYVLNGNHEVMNVAGDFRYVTPDGFRDYQGESGRAAAFRPGGPEARRLAERPVALVVGDTVFVHGGILPEHVRYGLGRLNRETSAWMRGERPTIPAILEQETAPIWSRAYSEEHPSDSACRALSQALAALSARRMVVGHTVQKDGITEACGGRVWRIDVGLSRFYGGKPSVLEITPKGERVIE